MGAEAIDHPLTRRTFLAAAAGAAVAVALPGCTREVRLGEADRRTLLRMSRLLYPHDTLGDRVYTEALRPLLLRADGNRWFAEHVRSGIRSLDAQANGDWLRAVPDRQIEALQRLQDQAFFQHVRNAVRTQLYEHPDVWDLIGYEGASVDRGGYLHRGFDTIDWLPAEDS